MIEVSMIPREYVDECWKKVENFVEKAAEYTFGRYDSSDIYALVTDYDHQLWAAFDGQEFRGVVVTNVAVYPRKKMLVMQFCGGERLSEWKDQMLSLLKRYARDLHCDGIEAVARPGWAKIFKDDGYQQNWVTFELPIGE